MKFVATEFKGTVDPLEAEQWIERMERVFRKLHYTEELKFEYLVSLLQRDVYEWWKTIPYSLVKPPSLLGQTSCNDRAPTTGEIVHFGHKPHGFVS